MKKLFIAVLLIALMLPLSTTSFAEDNSGLPEESLNLYLKDSGYPSEVIEYLKYDQKLSYFNKELKYVSHEDVTGTLAETKISKDGVVQTSEIGPMASLPNFVQYITTSVRRGTTSGVKRFYLSYNYSWNYNPTYTLTDKFGVSWTDGFDVIPSTIQTRYYTQGIHDWRGVHPNEYASYSSPLLTGATAADKYVPGAGIGWKVNIIGSFSAPSYYLYGNNVSFTTTSHSGFGDCEIVTNHNNDGGTESSSASGTYFHKFLSI